MEARTIKLVEPVEHDELLTAKKAGELLGLAPKTIRNYGSLGKLTRVKVGPNLYNTRYLSSEVRAMRLILN